MYLTWDQKKKIEDFKQLYLCSVFTEHKLIMCYNAMGVQVKKMLQSTKDKMYHKFWSIDDYEVFQEPFFY